MRIISELTKREVNRLIKSKKFKNKDEVIGFIKGWSRAKLDLYADNFEVVIKGDKHAK